MALRGARRPPRCSLRRSPSWKATSPLPESRPDLIPEVRERGTLAHFHRAQTRMVEPFRSVTPYKDRGRMKGRAG
jgi:hypothetical protein